MIPRTTLRVKLLLAVAVVIVPLFVTLLFDYRSDYGRRTETLLDSQMQTAQAVGALTEEAFDARIELAWAFAANPIVRSSDPNRIDPFLRGLKPMYPGIDAIAIFDVTGRNVGSFAVLREPRPNVADRRYFQGAMANNSPYVSEVTVSRGSGNVVIPVAVPIRDENGRPIGVAVVSQDVRSFPEILSTVGLHPGQAIFLADTTGRLAFHTRQPELTWEQRDVSGYPPFRSAVEGRPFRSAHSSMIFGDEGLVAATLTPKYGWVVGISVPAEVGFEPLRRDMQVKLAGYAVVVSLSVVLALLLSAYLLRPLRELADHAIALGKGNLGRRVRIETGDELQHLGDAFNTMADEVQKTLRLREEFLNVASHELRTPLTIVKGYAQWLLLKEQDETKRKAISTIVRQIDRMSELIQDMLEVSHIESGRLELKKVEFDLVSLAREVNDRLQPLTEKHRLLLSAEAPVDVVADRERIAVALTNLLDNAVRFSPEGGDVETRVGRCDGEAVVSVTDHGLGIPRELQGRVFEPFFQVYPAISGYGGLGLGLYITKQIVERHGGKMWFESEPGKGSTFYFTLPLSPS